MIQYRWFHAGTIFSLDVPNGPTTQKSVIACYRDLNAGGIMGIPAGIILKRKGYKVTALLAVAVGFIGVGIQFLSGYMESFGVYVLGAFIAGFSMCLLNIVVNPMLNTLGGGGNPRSSSAGWSAAASRTPPSRRLRP